MKELVANEMHKFQNRGLSDLDQRDPSKGFQSALFFFRKTVLSSFWKGIPHLGLALVATQNERISFSLRST